MKWRKQKEALAVPAVQIRNGSHHPFGMLGDYVPLRNGEVRLYRAVREAVPVVDASTLEQTDAVVAVSALNPADFNILGLGSNGSVIKERWSEDIATLN